MDHHIRTGPVGPPSASDVEVPTDDIAVDDICSNPNFSRRRDSIAEDARPELSNVPNGSPLYQPPDAGSQWLDLAGFVLRVLWDFPITLFWMDDHTCYQYRIRPEPVTRPPAPPDAAIPGEDFCPEESPFYLPHNPWPQILRIVWVTLLIGLYPIVVAIWGR